ncbi:MAG: hypothetical protein ACO1QB_17670, partial [Verrucomicrobiales bacterium]
AADVKRPKGVKRNDYRGWNDSLLLKGKRVQAIVVPEIGGRITHYSYKGENIIFENRSSAGKSLLNTTNNFWVGGYQADIGPELKGIPEHKELWMGPHRYEGLRANTIKTISPIDKDLGIRIEKDIMMDPDAGEIGIVQRLHNVSEKPVSYCIWDRTLCKGGGFAFFPLNPRSKFPAGWAIRKTVEGKYVYDGASPLHAKVKVLDGVLVAKAEGDEAKIGADSDAGWIAYARGKLLFVKYFPYYRNASYTDGGNSVELYFNQEVAELEPLSPETKLQPGAFYEFPEKWMLIPLEKEVRSHEEARALVELIPESPF